MHSKKQLKVFIDGYLFNKEHQGTTTYIKELYKEVALLNPNIEFYFGCFKDKKIIDEFSSILNIFFINYKNQSRVYRMIFEIPRIINNHKFDFAHFQYVIPLKKKKNCKYINTIHDVLFNDYQDLFSKKYKFQRNFLFKRSAKKSDFLLTVSEYSKKAIQKHYKLTNKIIYITPNGINKSYFEKFDKQIAKENILKNYGFSDYILYVSRIEPRKNQELLLKIYIEKKIFNTSTHLVFIGVNSIKNLKLQRIINSLTSNQKEKIHFYENINQVDLMGFYKGAKMFVYPSKAEGFGIPPLEAGAVKVPVLCSNTTAMESYTFFNPYFCNPNNEVLFTEKFIHLFSNLDSLELAKIQNEIKNKYSWKTSAKLITSILNNNFDKNKI